MWLIKQLCHNDIYVYMIRTGIIMKWFSWNNVHDTIEDDTFYVIQVASYIASIPWFYIHFQGFVKRKFERYKISWIGSSINGSCAAWNSSCMYYTER